MVYMLKHDLNTLNEFDIDQFMSFGGIISDPNSKNITLFIGKDDIDPEQYSHVSFGSLSFLGNLIRAYSVEKLIMTNKSDLIEFLRSKIQDPSKFKAQSVGSSDDFYENDFHSSQEKFSNSSLQKCVLKSREYFDIDVTKDSNILKMIFFFLQSPDGFLYGLWRDGKGHLGLTPETLVLCKNAQYSTMALAGTREKSKRDELLKDEKELIEHQLVIEDIKDKLSDEKLNVSETKLMDYNNVTHLFTPISFHSNKSPLSIIKRLTPTAALGGFPSQEAQSFLEKTNYHTKYGESFFGGTTFAQLEDQFISLVNIRNIQWDKDLFWIESGGGVVAQSVLEKERQEIQLKRKSISRLIFE